MRNKEEIKSRFFALLSEIQSGSCTRGVLLKNQHELQTLFWVLGEDEIPEEYWEQYEDAINIEVDDIDYMCYDGTMMTEERRQKVKKRVDFLFEKQNKERDPFVTLELADLVALQTVLDKTVI